MKNINNGFTLIELLAVIVILSIIALIAIPVVTSVIENAKISSAEASILGYVDEIDKNIVSATLKGEAILKDGFYDYDEIIVSLKGQIPNSGWFKVEKGQVTDYSFVINGYVVTKGDKTVQGITAKNKSYILGELIYFDPVSDDQCSEITFTGKNTCYKWRVIETNDNSSKSTITLQMDHNLINTTTWGPTNNTTGPITALTELNEQTKSWIRVQPLTYEYITVAGESNYGKMKCINGSCKLNDIIIVGTARARMITGDEVRDITNTKVTDPNAVSKSWTVASSMRNMFCFSNLKCVTGSNQTGIGNTDLAWLIENTTINENSGATSNGTNNLGYWTLSPIYNSKTLVWVVHGGGSFAVASRDLEDKNGVRPVLTILKSKISNRF